MGQPAIDPSAHPPEISGVGAQATYGGVCSPRRVVSVHPGSWVAYQGAPTCGFRCVPQATDWGILPLGHFGSGTQAAGPLIRARSHPEFQLWAPSLLIWVRASRASGECWGCLFMFTVQGLRVGGALEARAAAESSLISR